MGKIVMENRILFEGWRHEEKGILDLSMSDMEGEDIHYERSDEFQV